MNWLKQDAEEYRKAFGAYPAGYKPPKEEKPGMPSGLTALERAAWRQASRSGGGLVPDSTYGLSGPGLALAGQDSVALGQKVEPKKPPKAGDILSGINDRVRLNFALGRATKNDSDVVRNLAAFEALKGRAKKDAGGGAKADNSGVLGTRGPLEYQKQIGVIKKQFEDLLGPQYTQSIRGGAMTMQEIVDKAVADGRDRSPEIRDLIDRYAMYRDSLSSWHKFIDMGAKNPAEGFKLREELGEVIDSEEELARIGQEFNMTPDQLRDLYNAIK